MNKRIVPFLCLILLCLFLFAVNSISPSEVQASNTVFFVSPEGMGTACTQAAPCQPSQAISTAVDGDTLFFKGDTYGGITDPYLTVTQGITLYGGWDGIGTGGLNIDPDVYPTILDGEGVRSLIQVNDTEPDHVITVSGITFLNGYADAAYDNGGGIYVQAGWVFIQDSKFTSNYTDYYGGAVYVGSPNYVSLCNNVFTDNQAQYGGGGDLCWYGRTK